MNESERGAATVELVLLTPALVVLVLFVVFLGRLVAAQDEVTQAAYAAARAASLQRSPAQAQTQAMQAAQAVLTGHQLTCSPSSLSVANSGLRPGGTVTVELSCTTSLSDLSLLALPGGHTIAARASSPVDLYRGTSP